jgi:hypothetical protein
MRRVVVAFLLVVTSGTAYARQRDSERQAVDSLAVEIMGDTVSVWDFGAYENCNCVFVTAVTRVGDTLNIMQMDVEPVAARCNCLQDMRASTTGLPAGAYTAAVYRDLRVKFPEVAVIFVGAVQFEYYHTGGGFYNLSEFTWIWTSEQAYEPAAVSLAISGTDADFFFPYGQNTAGSGLSVRCLKD